MIYITGDTHGELDRFKSRALRGLGPDNRQGMERRAL